jgi:hypothetical protein
MAKGEKVTRPLKKSEYMIVFGSADSQRGWQDLLATQRTQLVDAWTQLTTDPLALTARSHPLKGGLATVTRNGIEYGQRQLELAYGARIWFYVDEMTVVIVKVHTRHPNQTKK